MKGGGWLVRKMQVGDQVKIGAGRDLRIYTLVECISGRGMRFRSNEGEIMLPDGVKVRVHLVVMEARSGRSSLAIKAPGVIVEHVSMGKRRDRE